jgi:hypothetical protein
VEHDLSVEFDGILSRKTISSLASQEVGEFEQEKVREFIPILAWRRARFRARAMAGSQEPERRN